jgi:hypothetical protein
VLLTEDRCWTVDEDANVVVSDENPSVCGGAALGLYAGRKKVGAESCVKGSGVGSKGTKDEGGISPRSRASRISLMALIRWSRSFLHSALATT